MTRRFADLMGGSDPYPAEEPQAANDRRPKVQPMPARPDYTQVEPSSTPKEYQWVLVGKDQVMIHPTATHDLMLEMSQHGHFSRPHAKGTLHLFDNWEAYFELLSSNMNLDLVRKALKKAARQHGWDFKGLIDEDGLPHSEKVASVKTAMPYQNNVWYHVTHRDRLRSIRDHGLTPTDRGNAGKNWDEYSIVTGGVYLSPSISTAESFRNEGSPMSGQTGWTSFDMVILQITGIDQRRLHPDPEGLTGDLDLPWLLSDVDRHDGHYQSLFGLMDALEALGGEVDPSGVSTWKAYLSLGEEDRQQVRDFWADRPDASWVYLGTIPAQSISLASHESEEWGGDWSNMGIDNLREDMASVGFGVDDYDDEFANQYKYRPLMGKVGMAADPNFIQQWIEKNGPYLYHGVSNRDKLAPEDFQSVIDRVAREGIRPDQRVSDPGPMPPPPAGLKSDWSNYNDVVDEDWRMAHDEWFHSPRPNHVFMAANPEDAYGPHVFRVDLRKLDPQRLKADEDWYRDEVGWDYDLANPRTMGQQAEEIGLGDDPEHTHRSLQENYQTVAHEGPIPPEAIEYIQPGDHDDAWHAQTPEQYIRKRQMTAADFGNGPINPGVKDWRAREWAGTDQFDQMPPPGRDDSPDESHPNHGPYECSECGEHFPDYGAWRQHVSDMHTTVPSRDEDVKPLINNDATFPPKLMDWSRVQDQAGVVAGWREAGMTRKKLLEYKDQLDSRLGKPTDEVVYQFDDGWTIRKPVREGDLAHAGCLMGNCMKNLTMESGYADTPISEPSIHTLNDPDGLPHVMWNYSPGYAVEDTEGRHGAPVKDAYKPYLTEWGKKEGVNGFYEIDGQPIYTKDERVTPELDESGDDEMADLIEREYPVSEQSERAHEEYLRSIADDHFREQHEIHNSIAGTHDQEGKTYHYTNDGHVFMREPAAGQQDADRYPEGLMYMPARQYPSEMYHTMADKGILPDRLRRTIDISRDSGLFNYDPDNRLHRLYMQQADLDLTPEEAQQAEQMRQNGLDEGQIKSVIETLRVRNDKLATDGWRLNA